MFDRSMSIASKVEEANGPKEEVEGTERGGGGGGGGGGGERMMNVDLCVERIEDADRR